MADQATIACPICGTAMKFTITTNRNGKHAVGVHCPSDGRHFRGFVNHRPFVEDALTRMAEAEQERQTADASSAAAEPALQKTSEGSRAKRSAKKARPA